MICDLHQLIEITAWRSSPTWTHPGNSGAHEVTPNRAFGQILWSRREAPLPVVADHSSGREGSFRYRAAHMVDRVTRDVTARGVRMRVVEAGSGPPLILIHDILVSHLEFESVLGPLADRFRVFAPDLPGFGESEKPSPARYAYR